jgi:hypothetical protein
MEPEIRKIGGKDNELISWQSIHQIEERKAVQVCVQAKTKLIPAFVQLLRLVRSPNRSSEVGRTKEGAHKQLKRGNDKLPIDLEVAKTNDLKITAGPITSIQDDLNTLPKLGHSGAIWCEPPFEVHTSGQPEADCSQLSNCCRTLQSVCDQFHQEAQTVMFPVDWKQVRGVLPPFQFNRPRWNRLFLECENSASRLLYALICYLEQNATISENVYVVEYKEADFFFMRNVNDAISGE